MSSVFAACNTRSTHFNDYKNRADFLVVDKVIRSASVLTIARFFVRRAFSFQGFTLVTRACDANRRDLHCNTTVQTQIGTTFWTEESRDDGFRGYFETHVQ